MSPKPAEPSTDSHSLQRLFKPYEEPSRHRAKGNKAGQARIINSRRPSKLSIVNSLRQEVSQWRESFYVGASKTSRHLLNHWFSRVHENSFRYHFCQREAIETLIYLMEVRKVCRLSELITEFGGANTEIEALGVNPEEDAWARYAFKLATGTGKTKCMSLAIVWSYFHNLYEKDSLMARHFVVIAPNLIVFERLREDFRPEEGGGDIFDNDPLIPPEWRADWNFSVVLQDEASGAPTGGALYLTNIHRLYPKRNEKKIAGTHSFAGPPVSKATALGTSAELWRRITSHKRLMVLNDEAHHVWDTDSAWNEAIERLHKNISLIAQLDFSATPRDAQGKTFRHTVCDTPLGEAVDGGIVKVPILGSSPDLKEQASDDAALRYDMHLRLGYERWTKSYKEWHKIGKMPLLFVMCESTEAADQIARHLNTSPVFSKLNGKTINLHTNLKGKIKKKGKGASAREVFVESEKEISDEDLKALRRLSRDLDSSKSPYLCIVSVLMLREGWDVRNVTTIVPLRAFSATSKILPEQTLGRGLRRMTGAGSDVNEMVTVIEHDAFRSLYEEELEQEGLFVGSSNVGDIEASTVSIFPDKKKDFKKLDIVVPRLSKAISVNPVLLGDLTEASIKKSFKGNKPLSLGKTRSENIAYEGKHLITDEIVELMKIHLPLLKEGSTSISYFSKKLEKICRLQDGHSVLAPLLRKFLSEILFDEKIELSDSRLIARLSDHDVNEFICATFIPAIRELTVKKEQRQSLHQSAKLKEWRSYQATKSKNQNVLQAQKTLFNLVPCYQALEVAMTQFLDRAPDVVAFAKNAGPQALRLDFLSLENAPSFYTPDFFVRGEKGNYFLVETKGREDRDVPNKADAAIQWCKQASTPKIKWQYVYVPQNLMEELSDNHFMMLVSACQSALKSLLSEKTDAPELPLFGKKDGGDRMSEFFGKDLVEQLTEKQSQVVSQCLELFSFSEKREGFSLAPVFQPLLGLIDVSARHSILDPLCQRLPSGRDKQEDWFSPSLHSLPENKRKHYETLCRGLKKGIIYDNLISPIGQLRNCMDYALNDRNRLEGILKDVKEIFRFEGARKLLTQVESINKLRNQHIAHSTEEPLLDREKSKKALKEWVDFIVRLGGSHG